MREYKTDFGIYRTGAYQSCTEVWYGKFENGLLIFITKKEFEDSINYKVPELDPLPF
jgi:hypothetical protein